MSFLLVLFLGGFALHCTIKEVPRETPSPFEIVVKEAIPVGQSDPSHER